MAWNVVIAGGGFAGAHAARGARAAAAAAVGAADRSSTTSTSCSTRRSCRRPPPGRSSRATWSRRCATCSSAPTCGWARSPAHDPRRARSSCTTHDGEVEELRYDQLLLALGSVSRLLPVPGLDEHAIGFKSLADAIWLRNHVIETLEARQRHRGPGSAASELLTYVFVGGGYAGLEALAELQDFAADAIERYPRARLHGMRWILVEATDRVLPEIDADLADYALRELRGRGIDIRLGTRSRRSTEAERRLSTGETIPTRTVVWTTGVAAAPEPARAQRAARRARPGARRRAPCASQGMDGVWAIGDCAAVPGPRRAGSARRPPSTRSARARPSPATSPPSSASARPRAVRLPRTAARSSTSAATRRSARLGPLQVPRLPRLVAGAHLPREPDPGRRRASSRAVVDWTVGLPFRRDTAEVGSIGHPRPLRAEVYERGGTHRPWLPRR